MEKPKQAVLSEEEARKRPMVRTPKPDHFSTWANDAQITHTPWDFSISFGQLRQATKEKLEIADAATIHLSPQFAVQLLRVLKQNISRYESNFGKIAVPKGLETDEDDDKR